MRKRRNSIRIISAAMAASLVVTNLGSTIAYAQEGYSEMNSRPNPALADTWRDYTFSHWADELAGIYGVTPTGLALNLTNTHRRVKNSMTEEPNWYGKWWLSNYKGKAGKGAVTVSGEGDKKTVIDFSQLANHFTSCIQDHKSDQVGTIIAGNGIQGTRQDPYGTQFFATEAYYPGNNAANYPLYIRNAAKNDLETMKFYLLLMCAMHAFQPSDLGYDNETAMKDDEQATVHSMLTFSMTLSLEDTGIGSQIHTAGELLQNMAGIYSANFMDGYGPNINGYNFYDKLFGTQSLELARWFQRRWNEAMFMSQFEYSMEPGKDGTCDLTVAIRFTDAALGADGKYHKTWDYSEFAAKYPDIAREKNAAITLSTTGPGSLTVTNQNNILDISADTAEDLERELQNCLFVIKDSNTNTDMNGVTGPTEQEGKNSGQQIQPAGLIGGRFACVFTDAAGNPVNMMSNGQLRFVAFTKELALKATSKVRDPKDPPPSTPDEIIRYKHTEQFSADYNVRLKKFDSETGQPLEHSYWDILEAFPDADGQLGATSLEEISNWGNDSGSQFMKWKGWDFGDGHMDGDPANDPCSDDLNATNKDGDLTYDNGDIAHTDTKHYTYMKGFCGGHPAKPEPEKDPETGEIENQDEIDAWEDEVETCQKLINEAATGYYCATAENGYTGGEDADGAKSKKEMEDDRDARYAEFIGLKYKYSATEVQARPGYINHDTHTDDIPIEEKTVTSSQLKEFNSSYGGNAGNLPHRDSPASAAGGSNPGGSGSNEGDDADAESLTITSAAAFDEEDASLKTESIATDSDAKEITIDTKNSSKVTLEADAPNNAYLDYLENLDTLETEAATSSTSIKEETEEEQDDAEKEELPDLILADDTKSGYGVAVISTASDAARATDSEAAVNGQAKVSWFENLYGKVQEMAEKFYQMLQGAWDSFISLLSDDDEGSARSSSHSVRDSVTWTEDGPGNYVAPLTSDIVDHTFTVFDHRTEGEIHINKRDLDLRASEKDNAAYDAYADENGDGTLEGAVYGLFAAQNVEHPDGHTGTVYQKDDLLSVATTDRNGDASFMTFTEAPGSTYDYEAGGVVKRTDQPFDGPDNLHKPQADGDATAQDNEQYIGYDSQNQAVSIEDSEEGNDTVYYKHSSNQDGIEGLEGGHEVYPILNNEENNGNCWIGRPLIVGENGTQYYIKELSRSEGYELSVTGKTNQVTNGAGSYVAAPSSMSVSIGSITYKPNGMEMPVTATGVDRDVQLEVTTGKGASFATVSKKKETYKTNEYTTVPVEKIVLGGENERIQLNGQYVEAAVGQTITVNGKAYTVTRVSDPVQTTMGAVPANKTIRNVVQKTTLGSVDVNDFKEKFNAELLANKFKTPDAHAPWIRVPLVGTSDTDWIGAVNSAMTDQGILFFNAARITDIITENGKTYAVIRYNHATSGKVDPCVYNTEHDSLYVKQTTASGDFIYVEVPANSDLVTSVNRNETGFIQSASLKKFTVNCNTVFPAELPSSYILNVENPKTYWVYDGKMQKFNQDGTLATWTDYTQKVTEVTREREVDVLTDLLAEYDEKTGKYLVTIPQAMFAGSDTVTFRIYGKENSGYANLGSFSIIWKPADAGADSFIMNTTLTYPDQSTVYESSGTEETPVAVSERSLRQKIRIDKDIQKLKESKSVWYCLNCGYENGEGDVLCGFCGHTRTTEETKTIDYAHDTYGAVHAENISADREDGWYDTVKDWFAKLLKLESKDESTESIGNFRFKAYLKSNLERLYRKADGTITWVDRNGNEMIPQYEDKAADDGNYDTFTWKYAGAFGGKTVDFPEKDKTSADGTLESSNVQKIYTEVEHNKESKTSSARANNVWASYGTPQGGNTTDVGDIRSYTTSERGTSGQAVKNNSSLYSYDGKLVDADRSDKLNDTANSGYTRILESTLTTIEDEGTTREVEMYNYEKFFDAIHAANTDIWDDDMHSTFTGDAMKNYPGQHWFKTFYEKYQKDDTDPGHTKANTDGADKDGTAGGDKDTSFKPFRWIRENVFGYRDGYEKYPADNNGVNTEVTANTSDLARANAEASDAVRQFAVKWYLQDEAAKLMVDNGQGENVALKGGTIGYDEAVYDEALFNAIAKAYNYLKPFYFYDLDTIYSVEWDSAKDGGADKDHTTLSADELHNGTYYNTSSYLPYGVYVIVEQQPERRDKDVNDWKNRSYDIEKPKEVIVPSVYDAEKSNDTSDNYDPHYNFDTDMALQKQAKASNYLIRFGEELSANTENQDEREFVIRAHGYYGDFEVYKYGLDIDGLSGAITAPNGAYGYHGWELRQGYRDPLKDYYEYDHRGEAGITEIGAELGGNNESKYHGYEQENGNGKDTANGETYDGDTLRKRFFYASVSEDDGTADNVLYKDGAKDDNNASGMNWKDNIPSTTGELTAYDKLYSAALVPWSVTAPANLDIYSSKDFTGYADVKERNRYYVSYLRVNKVDSETGEYILHDDAIFGLYAASRYTSFDEIEEDAKLIEDADERARFLMQFKPGDAKFYLKDTHIVGSKEFLEAMGATDLQISTGRTRTPIVESQEDTGHTYTGLVRKGTPVCVESERIDLSDDFGKKTGQMTVWSTKADVKMDDPVTGELKDYGDQNIGYFKTSQPVSAGVYVLAEIKPPAGYARSKPVAIEVYSDETSYYVDGDMYAKVAAVRYDGNLLTDIPYEK